MTALLQSLVETSLLASATGSRLAKRNAIAAFLRTASADEVPIAVAYLSGDTPQGRFGLGYATLSGLRGPSSPNATLTLREVDAALTALAATVGKGSAAARADRLRALFARATAAEQDFLVRLLVGELRQGALEGVMFDAVAEAAGMPAAEVRRAAMVTGNLGQAARVAMAEGLAGLSGFAVALHRPVQPMLAQPAESIADALAQLGTAAFEWKVDGARVQVHKAGTDVRVYTRNLNEVTGSVPEIVEAVQAVAARELILDGEAVALTLEGAPQPFQVTMRRFGRKLDVAPCAPTCRSPSTFSTACTATAHRCWTGPARSASTR